MSINQVKISSDNPAAIAAFPWWEDLAKVFFGVDAEGNLAPSGTCNQAREDNPFVKNPNLQYLDGVTCDSDGARVKPGICKFVKGQTQCVQWEDFACFCLGTPIPEEPKPEPKPEPENPDPTGDDSDDDTNEDNKQEESDGKKDDDKKDGDMKMDDDWMMYTDPMMGQVTYTSVAVMSAIGAGLDMFRYNPSSTKYSQWSGIGATASTPYWMYGGELARYTMLSFFSVASVTQILSCFGVAPDVNMMVWMYGGMASSVLGLVAHGLLMYSYDLANTALGSMDAGEKAAAEAVIDALELDFIAGAAHETLVGIELYEQGANWMAAQMMMMGKDKKEEMKEEMKGEDGQVPQ